MKTAEEVKRCTEDGEKNVGSEIRYDGNQTTDFPPASSGLLITKASGAFTILLLEITYAIIQFHGF